MIISSVACHVNFTYTSLYSFTAERGWQKWACLGSLPCRTHTHTHSVKGGGYGYYLSLENHPSSAPNCESNSSLGSPCAVLVDRTANDDCNSFLCLDSLLILLRSSWHWGRKCFSFSYIDPSGRDKSIETMERPLQTRDQSPTVFVVH